MSVLAFEGTATETVVFLVAGAACLAGAVGVVVARNPVHAALSLVGTLFGIAVLFVAHEAHFLAAVQVIVYAGAIVVLFLFVIMLLGVDRDEDVRAEPLRGQRPAAAALGGAVVLLVIVAIVTTDPTVTGRPSAEAPARSGVGDVDRASLTDPTGQLTYDLVDRRVRSGDVEVARIDVDRRQLVVTSAGAALAGLPAGTRLVLPETLVDATGARHPTEELLGVANVDRLGRSLFTRHVFAFEVTSALLVVAVIAAVTLARRPPRSAEMVVEPGGEAA